MNTFKKIALTSLALLAFGGCRNTKYTQSGIMTERGKVYDTWYSASQHGSGIGPTINLTGEGGIGVAFTSVDIPEKYALIIDCEHGVRFITEGTDEEHKKLYYRISRGDSVDISYRENYTEVWDGDSFISREHTGYNFLDALKK
ncbi:hypothetical protein HYT23_00665 [Candidatus Pacearchaeota archaeon]|nr:hypothetical protein [Candidatus Pacearchaeota archaeon]